MRKKLPLKQPAFLGTVQAMRQLKAEDVHLMIDALDQHIYWQLADRWDRSDGRIVGRSLEKPEVQHCQSLIDALKGLLGNEHSG